LKIASKPVIIIKKSGKIVQQVKTKGGFKTTPTTSKDPTVQKISQQKKTSFKSEGAKTSEVVITKKSGEQVKRRTIVQDGKVTVIDEPIVKETVQKTPDQIVQRGLKLSGKEAKVVSRRRVSEPIFFVPGERGSGQFVKVREAEAAGLRKTGFSPITSQKAILESTRQTASTFEPDNSFLGKTKRVLKKTNIYKGYEKAEGFVSTKITKPAFTALEKAEQKTGVPLNSAKALAMFLQKKGKYKAAERVLQFQTGAIKPFKEKPLATTTSFVVGYGVGAAGKGVALASKAGAITIKSLGAVGTTAYVGSVATGTVTSPKPFEFLGEQFTKTGVFVAGARLGAAKIKTPEPKIVSAKFTESKQISDSKGFVDVAKGRAEVRVGGKTFKITGVTVQKGTPLQKGTFGVKGTQAFEVKTGKQTFGVKTDIRGFASEQRSLSLQKVTLQKLSGQRLIGKPRKLQFAEVIEAKPLAKVQGLQTTQLKTARFKVGKTFSDLKISEVGTGVVKQTAKFPAQGKTVTLSETGQISIGGKSLNLFAKRFGSILKTGKGLTPKTISKIVKPSPTKTTITQTTTPAGKTFLKQFTTQKTTPVSTTEQQFISSAKSIASTLGKTQQTTLVVPVSTTLTTFQPPKTKIRQVKVSKVGQIPTRRTFSIPKTLTRTTPSLKTISSTSLDALSRQTQEVSTLTRTIPSLQPVTTQITTQAPGLPSIPLVSVPVFPKFPPVPLSRIRFDREEPKKKKKKKKRKVVSRKFMFAPSLFGLATGLKQTRAEKRIAEFAGFVPRGR